MAAEVDVTGAVNGWQETCVDRSHRREFVSHREIVGVPDACRTGAGKRTSVSRLGRDDRYYQQSLSSRGRLHGVARPRSWTRIGGTRIHIEDSLLEAICMKCASRCHGPLRVCPASGQSLSRPLRYDSWSLSPAHEALGKLQKRSRHDVSQRSR